MVWLVITLVYHTRGLRFKSAFGQEKMLHRLSIKIRYSQENQRLHFCVNECYMLQSIDMFEQNATTTWTTV